MHGDVRRGHVDVDLPRQQHSTHSWRAQADKLIVWCDVDTSVQSKIDMKARLGIVMYTVYQHTVCATS
jgi:hypothetical protein